MHCIPSKSNTVYIVRVCETGLQVKWLPLGLARLWSRPQHHPRPRRSHHRRHRPIAPTSMIDPVRGNIDQWPLHCGLMFAEGQSVEDIFGSCSQPTLIKGTKKRPRRRKSGYWEQSVCFRCGGGIIDRDRCGHGLWAKVIQTVTGSQGSRPLYKLYLYKYTKSQIHKYTNTLGLPTKNLIKISSSRRKKWLRWFIYEEDKYLLTLGGFWILSDIFLTFFANRVI